MSGWGSVYQMTCLGLSRQGQALADLQQMAATGVRLRRTSDDPVDAYRLLGLREDSARLETYRSNINRISGSLAVATDVLSEMSSLVARARELVTQGTSGTYSASNRQPIAHEINALLEQMVLLANTDHSDQYVFGGEESRTAPYEPVVDDAGRITDVLYVGGSHAIEAPVSTGVTRPTGIVGDAVFRGHARGRPEFLGDSGAAPGTGTSTVRTHVWLTLTHAATSYLGASGIGSGTSSAGGDTILGNGHTMTIDVPGGTLRLDDGPDVAYTPGDTDCCVTGADGDCVWVDTSGLMAGYQGTVGIQSTGSVSIDDGASTTAIDFADTNLAVTDSATGRVLYVDATGVTRTGVDTVRVTGTADVFASLITVRDLFLNTRGLSEADQLAYLNGSVQLVNEASEALTLAQTSVGADLGLLSTLDEAMEIRQNHASDQAAALENADIVQLATDLARQQTLYEMTLASASTLLRLSLFDYLTY